MRYYRFATPEEVEESLASSSPDGAEDEKFALLWRDLDTADVLVSMGINDYPG